MNQALKNPLVVFGLSIGGLIAVILAFAYFGVTPRFLEGEEFAVFHHASNFDHFTAWRNYFHEVGRPLTVAYWIYLYEFVGFKPLLIHSMSLVLVLAAAVAGALCFWLAWPKHATIYAPTILLVLFFFNWVSAERVFKVSSDQSHLSVAIFMLAGLTLQRWAQANGANRRWFALSGLLFLLSLLAYEAVTFLFPVLLLLAWPLVPAKSKKKDPKLFLGLAILSQFSLLVPYSIYQINDLPNRLFGPYDLDFVIDTVTSWFAHMVNVGNWIVVGNPPVYGLPSFVFFATLLLSIHLLVKSWRGRTKKEAALLEHRLCVFAAALLLVLGGTLPYDLGGFAGIEPRAYHAAILGFAPLSLFLFDLSKGTWVRILSVALMLASLGLSFVEMERESSLKNALEFERNTFYVGLKEEVPNVQTGTVFIIIDYPLSNSGCGPTLNMLYNTTDTRCAFFSSTLPEYRAIRYENYIAANRGGALGGNDWILVRINENGDPMVVDELRKGDYDLIIYWLDETPIRTRYDQFVYGESLPSDFYLDLLKRRSELVDQE